VSNDTGSSPYTEWQTSRAVACSDTIDMLVKLVVTAGLLAIIELGRVADVVGKATVDVMGRRCL
jgi:hypothetical protein